jgi:hypothetical protein
MHLSAWVVPGYLESPWWMLAMVVPGVIICAVERRLHRWSQSASRMGLVLVVAGSVSLIARLVAG